MLYSEKHLHAGQSQGHKSMLKHIMRKCKVVNYVDKESWEWNTDLIETKKLENYTCQVAQTCTAERRNTNLEELTNTFFGRDEEQWMKLTLTKTKTRGCRR